MLNQPSIRFVGLFALLLYSNFLCSCYVTTYVNLSSLKSKDGRALLANSKEVSVHANGQLYETKNPVLDYPNIVIWSEEELKFVSIDLRSADYVKVKKYSHGVTALAVSIPVVLIVGVTIGVLAVAFQGFGRVNWGI